MGLKIAQVLLENANLWRKPDPATVSDGTLRRNVRPKIEGQPMLVVCYTNHALDQFLEGTVVLYASTLHVI